MKCSTVLVFAASAYGVAASGIATPLCMAACTPLVINPIAFAACAAGCAALGVEGDESHNSPRFLPDGTVVFEKESDLCAEACKPLVNAPVAYSACLGGCASVPRK